MATTMNTDNPVSDTSQFSQSFLPEQVYIKCEVNSEGTKSVSDGEEFVDGTLPVKLEDIKTEVKVYMEYVQEHVDGQDPLAETIKEEVNMSEPQYVMLPVVTCVNENPVKFQKNVAKESEINFISNEKLHNCTICNKNFATNFGLKLHLNHCLKKSLICNFCQQKFSSKANITLHMKVHIKQHAYKCSSCSLGFNQKSQLRQHVLYSHKEYFPSTCNVCKRVFFHSYILQLHFLSKHTEKVYYSCEICNKSYTKECSLNVHMRVHTSSNSHICKKCGKSFSDDNDLKLHLLKVHIKSNLNQKMEETNLVSENALNETNNTKNLCKICNSTYSTPYYLKEHVTRYHKGQSSYECNFCKKMFFSIIILNVHIRHNHINKRPYKCDQCNSTFTDSKTYENHLKSHSNIPKKTHLESNTLKKIKQNKPPLDVVKTNENTTSKLLNKSEIPQNKSKLKNTCNNNFMKQKCLTKTENQRYKCKYCYRFYINLDSLKIHIKVHKKEHPNSLSNEDLTSLTYLKPDENEKKNNSGKYICTICNKCYVSKGTLKTHILNIHRGKNLFKCNYCNKTFNYKGNLNAHLQVHTNVRPYSCTLCEKSFRQISVLKSHIRHHTKESSNKSKQIVENNSKQESSNCNTYQCTVYSSKIVQKMTSQIQDSTSADIPVKDQQGNWQRKVFHGGHQTKVLEPSSRDLHASKVARKNNQ